MLTRARLERHLPFFVAVNERFILFIIIEDVTGCRLGDGVSAYSPRRDVKLSASSPCGLLKRSQVRSRNSIQLGRTRTLDNQWINL